MDRSVESSESFASQSDEIRGDFASSVVTHRMGRVRMVLDQTLILTPKGNGAHHRIDQPFGGLLEDRIPTAATSSGKADIPRAIDDSSIRSDIAHDGLGVSDMGHRLGIFDCGRQGMLGSR